MNIRAAFIAMISVASLVAAAEPGIEFSGVMTTGGKTQLALTNTATKTTTWVEPGEQFNGYTIARYDPKEDAVFIKKGGEETRLGLVVPKTTESRPTALSGATNLAATVDATATANAIRANLRQLASMARQYLIEHGTASVTYSDLVGPDKLIKELKPIAGENYSTLSFGPNVTAVSVITANGATIALDIPSASAPATNAAATAQTSPPSTTAAPAAAPVSSPAASNPPAIAATASPTPSTPAPTVPSAPEALEPTGRQPASPNYTIQGGDTWQKISESTGVTVQRLKELNPTILEGNPLPSGQSIRIR
jgi:LysM repeat protein